MTHCGFVLWCFLAGCNHFLESYSYHEVARQPAKKGHCQKCQTTPLILRIFALNIQNQPVFFLMSKNYEEIAIMSENDNHFRL